MRELDGQGPREEKTLKGMKKVTFHREEGVELIFL